MDPALQAGGRCESLAGIPPCLRRPLARPPAAGEHPHMRRWRLLLVGMLVALVVMGADSCISQAAPKLPSL